MTSARTSAISAPSITPPHGGVPALAARPSSRAGGNRAMGQAMMARERAAATTKPASALSARPATAAMRKTVARIKASTP